MQYIYHDISLQHQTGQHPECAARLAHFAHLPQTELPAADSLLSLVHTDRHIRHVKRAAAEGIAIDGDTVTSAKSYEAAVASVGAAVLASEIGGFSLMRPPGHHAYAEKASGFCLFNSIAVAAQNAANKGKKVLLLDFDGHFGDGTSDIFYADKNVLYWSVHQSPAFPFKGAAREIGSGAGRGFNWNVPLPPGSGDDVFLDALRTFLPLAKQFAPDTVGISAGFDAHCSDPLLQLNFSLHAFYEVGLLLRKNFTNIFAVLEGGYNLEYLPRCIKVFKAGIEGLDMPYSEPRTATPQHLTRMYQSTKNDLLQEISPYWKIS